MSIKKTDGDSHLVGSEKRSLFAVATLMLFIFMLGEQGYSQITSNASTTDWSTTTGWSCTCVPNMTFWDGTTNDTEVSHDKTVTGNLEITNANRLTVKAGATVTITGDLQLGNTGEILIENGGTLVVNGSIRGSAGNVNTGNASMLQIDNGGTLTVGTNFNVGNSGINYNWSGTVTIGGNFGVVGNTSVTLGATGNVTVTGDLSTNNNGVILGTGVISWGGATSVGAGCGSNSYIECTGAPGSPRHSTGGCYAAIPSNPLSLNTCGSPCAALVAGTIAAAQSICEGDDVAAFTSTVAASGGDGATYDYQWQSSTTSAVAGFADIGGATLATYNHGVLATTTWFRRAVTSGSCGTEYTAAIEVTVTPNNTAGAASSTPTLCVNTALTNITHVTTGATGIANNGVDGANGLPAGVSASWAGNTITISGTPSASGVFGYSIPLTGGCGSINATGTITVTADRTVGAASTATQTICYNTAITAITHATTGVTGITSSAGLPTGVTASYAADVITISGTATQSGTFNYTITPTSDCGTATATGQIIVHAEFDPGSIAADQSIAHNTTPAALSSAAAAAGGGGFNYQWQISTDNAAWSDIGGATGATYTPPAALTQSTYYRRAAVSTAGCGTLYSNTVTVTVIVNVCSGGTPPELVEATGGAVAGGGGWGTYSYQWQSSTTSAVAGFSDISGATDSVFTPTSVSADTWYRRCVTSNGCTACTEAVKATIKESPGGISSNMLVWLKAGSGTGSLNTSWNDQSGNGYNYTTVTGPTLITADSAFNYQPVVEITDGGFDAPAGAELGNEWTVIFVSRLLQSDTDGRIFEGHSSNFLWVKNS